MRRLLPVLLLVVLCLPIRVVEVGADSSQPARRLCPRDGISVSIRYVHSVERTRVEEHYQAGRDGLRLILMRWQSSGAGLPSEYDSCGDGYYVREMDIEVGRVLDYWFLPLNEVEVSVGGDVVFRGPDSPSLVKVRVRSVLLAVWCVDSLRGG